MTLTVVLAALVAIATAAPERQLDFGRVEGKDFESQVQKLPYHAYLGIPFAAPPVGDFRLKKPQPYMGNNPNMVVNPGSEFQNACIQPIFAEYPMSEDCLYLNVFTPTNANPQGPPKKVMVWVYGGAFIYGDAYSYIPSGLVAEQDVIVVTFHYRLNMFGFLASGNGDGNYGLWDQIAALQWVQKHISGFGGDPKDVTIFGESAGAGSAGLLSLTPAAKGLFNKVILQSGSPVAQWTVNRDPGPVFDRVARAAGCTPWWYSSLLRGLYRDTVLACLRKTDLDSLGGVALGVMGFLDEETPGKLSMAPQDMKFATFLPVIDGEMVVKDPLTAMTDMGLLRAAGTLDRKYYMGVTNAETIGDLQSFLKDPRASVDVAARPDIAEDYVQTVAKESTGGRRLSRPAEMLLNYEYTYPRSPSGKADLMNVLEAGRDVHYLMPMLAMAEGLLAANKDIDVFVYLFDYFPKEVNKTLGIRGASHAMDLLFQWDFSLGMYESFKDYAKIPANDESGVPLVGIFQSTLADFAKTGLPRGAAWPRWTPENEDYMALSPTPEVRQGLYTKRRQLWRDVIAPMPPRGPLRRLASFFGR